MLDGTKSECFFLDVGQGTSQIITLGQGRAIVIDSGPADSCNILLQTLENMQIHTLEVVVFSHNDDDHIGNATNLLQQYPKSVKDIYIMRDRDIHNKKVRYLHLLRYIDKAIREENLCKKAIHELIPDRNRDETILFREVDVAGVETTLALIYPTALWDSMQAQMDEAVLVRILWRSPQKTVREPKARTNHRNTKQKT